ncbi:MAG: hypothetical protein L7F78_22500, partial [Syntrophales bacterium LBB04]|nr:hypothetical protein [Syntrophales bacterium LBB04]
MLPLSSNSLDQVESGRQWCDQRVGELRRIRISSCLRRRRSLNKRPGRHVTQPTNHGVYSGEIPG